jgi:hypothetical protein
VGVGREKALICSVCWFSWHKYSPHGWFWASVWHQCPQKAFAAISTTQTLTINNLEIPDKSNMPKASGKGVSSIYCLHFNIIYVTTIYYLILSHSCVQEVTHEFPETSTTASGHKPTGCLLSFSFGGCQPELPLSSMLGLRRRSTLSCMKLSADGMQMWMPSPLSLWRFWHGFEQGPWVGIIYFKIIIFSC